MRAVGLLSLITTFVFVTSGCKEADVPPPPAAEVSSADAPPSKAAPSSQPEHPTTTKPASQPLVAPEPPPPVEPSASAPDPVSPYTLSALTPGAICTYEYTEAMNEELGADLYAGREIAVRYVLRAKPPKKDAPIVFEAEVEHVAAKGRREATRYDLDTLRPADMQRVRGGADATIEPEMVALIAMQNIRVTIELDERGVLKRVTGADAIRKKFLDYHPPAPRKNPHFLEKAKLRMSDEAIAGRFLPYAIELFEDGAIEEARQDAVPGEVLHPDHRADFMRGRRIKSNGKKIMFQTKWAFAPSKKKHVVPDLRDEPLKGFLGGDGTGLVAFEAKNPCFLEAAQTRTFRHKWEGLVQGEPVNTHRLRTLTRIWRKVAGS